MKLIKSSYEILEQGPGLEGIYEAIERAGRTCYKSKRPEGQTAEGFVNRMVASQHYAMLEHGTVYLTIRGVVKPFVGPSNFGKYLDNPYSKVVFGEGTTFYITTNYRALVENGWLNDLKYLCEPTEYHERRVTVRFTTSNGIMREFTRHRAFSFAVESTRYCNYSKDKFNNEVTFIQPYWCRYEISNKTYPSKLSIMAQTPISNYIPRETAFLVNLIVAEEAYLNLLDLGCTPQEAREVLPLATKCDMIMTGFVSDWKHFFRLRTSILAETGKPHPDASALADPLMHEFEERGLCPEFSDNK